MDAFYERLLLRAVTIDELFSDIFEQLPGQMSDTDLAAQRLAAWCRSSASGDWSLFVRRLARDGLSIEDVLARFATVRRSADMGAPRWIDDAVWIGEALQCPAGPEMKSPMPAANPTAFEELLTPVADAAEARLWSGVDAHVGANVGDTARARLRRSLLSELSNLSAPAIYDRFAKVRNDAEALVDAGERSPGRSTVHYDRFVSDMKADGFRRLFEDKPVLLRLMAVLTRQWIETSRELITRLDADLPAIRRDLCQARAGCAVTGIDGELSDPHNSGRTVRIISFQDGSRVVYKPKDLCVDAAWHALIERLNHSAPLDLRAVRVLPRVGYGWTEFVDHVSCPGPQSFRRFFRRAGAWLALFHCFGSVDMHQENMIAVGEHPVPIDLEMILQAAEPSGDGENTRDAKAGAYEAAMATVINSVLTVGLLPAYGRYSTSETFAIGGVTSNTTARVKLTWTGMNSDTMRPVKAAVTATTIANLPHVDGCHGRLGDHPDDFMSGFDDYVRFLQQQHRDDLFDDFAGLTIRNVIRPTSFYSMLLRRLRDHRAMHDGIVWSAQADFATRLADWEHDSDPTWPLQRAERAAVVELNVPHFVMNSDGHEIRDAGGISILTDATSGFDRARTRVADLNEAEITWQEEVIRQNTGALRRARPNGPSPNRLMVEDARTEPGRDVFTEEADAVARTLSEHAIRKGPSAAWIGLDWVGDSEVSQLVVLGPDLYNGACGIALFFAAHAAVAHVKSSHAVALAALARLREMLRGRYPARVARSLGLGAGLGMGSIVYSLAVMSGLLDDDDLLADAHAAAELITDEIISADRQLDVLGGSAGAILGLLRLYRQTGSSDVLVRATNCGRHLLAQHRVGQRGRRSWPATVSGCPLNGMSHGAAGFAYALASLASATRREEFASAAKECVVFENETFDAEHGNWPDLRGAGAVWKCKWCYGAPGIGLARVAMKIHAALDSEVLQADIHNALAGVERGWPAPTDTLCCGTLGSIEFVSQAARALGRTDLEQRAVRRLRAVIGAARSSGDYQWSSGSSRFNLGFFRGVAGVGYTALRRVDASLPNVLIWE